MTKATILLVEDNPDDEALTLRAFTKAQIENPIAVARDGQEAIDMLHGPDRVHPAMVLLDLKLPKIDGLDVLARLRQDERTRTLPVVVLTSSREEEDLVRSYQLGANSYVRKPVGFTEFIDAARQLGLYWLVLNERPAGLDA
jgi:CheY-like chemotaxis protein